jgi:hypothetical protein
VSGIFGAGPHGKSLLRKEAVGADAARPPGLEPGTHSARRTPRPSVIGAHPPGRSARKTTSDPLGEREIAPETVTESVIHALQPVATGRSAAMSARLLCGDVRAVLPTRATRHGPARPASAAIGPMLCAAEGAR